MATSMAPRSNRRCSTGSRPVRLGRLLAGLLSVVAMSLYLGEAGLDHARWATEAIRSAVSHSAADGLWLDRIGSALHPEPIGEATRAQVTVREGDPKRKFEEVEDRPWTLWVGKAMLPATFGLLAVIVIWYVVRVTKARYRRP